MNHRALLGFLLPAMLMQDAMEKSFELPMSDEEKQKRIEKKNARYDREAKINALNNIDRINAIRIKNGMKPL